MFSKKATMAPMKATITEETDAGSFFAVVLLTLLVAFVLLQLVQQLASRMWTPKKKKQEEAMSTLDMIEMHMAEREMYRYSKNVTTPNVFEQYEQDDTSSDGDQSQTQDWDDNITVASLMEVQKKGEFHEFRKKEMEDVDEEEEEEEASSVSRVVSYRLAF
jgi:hypothetical protein